MARRTVVVVGRFPPPRDGQSVATERLATLLERRAHVIRFDTSPGARDQVVATTRLRLRRVAHYLQLYGRLSSLLGSHPNAMVIWTSISPGILGHLRDVLTVLPCLGRDRPVVAVSHRATLERRFVRIGSRFSMRLLVERVSAFVFLTRDLSDSVSRWISDTKRVVIPNTIDDALDQSDEAVDRKQIEHAGRARLELLFVSNLMPEKGWADVLRSLPMVERRGIPFRIRFAGRFVDEADEAHFAQLVRDNHLDGLVESLGGIDDTRVLAALYLEADALVLPTYHPTEAMPLTVIEALAAGTPVVTTAQGGLAEMITDGRDGIRVRPRTPGDIADAIGQLSDVDRWLSLSRGARKTYLERYAPGVVEKRWLGLLDEMEATAERAERRM